MCKTSLYNSIKRLVLGLRCQGQAGEFFEEWKTHRKPCCFHFSRNWEHYRQENVECGNRQAIIQAFIVFLLSKSSTKTRKLNHSAARYHEKNLWSTWGEEMSAEAGLVLFLEIYIRLMPLLQCTLNYELYLLILPKSLGRQHHFTDKKWK